MHPCASVPTFCQLLRVHVDISANDVRGAACAGRCVSDGRVRHVRARQRHHCVAVLQQVGDGVTKPLAPSMKTFIVVNRCL